MSKDKKQEAHKVEQENKLKEICNKQTTDDKMKKAIEKKLQGLNTSFNK